MTPTIASALIPALVGMAWAHLPEGETYYAVQFPDHAIPVIDGNLDDWDRVPERYSIRTGQLFNLADMDITGRRRPYDPSDIEILHRVGYNANTERLYFASVVFDNDHNSDRDDAGLLWRDDDWEVRINPTAVNVEQQNVGGEPANSIACLFAVPPVEGVYQRALVAANDEPEWLLDTVDFGWSFSGAMTGGQATYYYEMSTTPVVALGQTAAETEFADLEHGDVVHYNIITVDVDMPNPQWYSGIWAVSPGPGVEPIVDLYLAELEDVWSVPVGGWLMDLSITNNVGESRTLTLGLALGATNAIDTGLGEHELPPLPPAEMLDVRCDVPGTNGSVRDLRGAGLERTAWVIRLQGGEGGYPLTFAWDVEALPEGSVRLQDAVTEGQLVDVDMQAQASYELDRPGLTLMRVVYGGEVSTNEWTVDITATEVNGGQVVLQFGTAAEASDEVDPALGEVELPPWSPAGNFEARWLTPGGYGLRRDLRSHTVVAHEYTLAFQRAVAGGVVTLSWDHRNLPACCSFRVQDPVGGLLFDQDIRAVGELEIDNPGLTRVTIRVVADRFTAVEEEHRPVRPEGPTLSQNYPNPFNNATLIRFSLPRQTDLSLAIYDLAGQKVATLVEPPTNAGSHSVAWNGRSDNGRALATGVYLCRLQAGDGQVATRKLLLLR